MWFRLPKGEARSQRPLAEAGPGRIVITLDRGDYWQCAYVIEKGAAESLRAAGVEAFRARIAEAAPELAESARALAAMDDVKLLTVKVDRLAQWWRPGFLCIGDAAHAMSPVGGVGVNLAVQDAVAAANILAPGLSAGDDVDALLRRVQRRRSLPTRLTQFAQVQAQNRILRPILDAPGRKEFRAPAPLRLIAGAPLLQRLFARMVGLGFRPERPSRRIIAGAA
jgi:2-polyprenyl-6-methoxyphenol hydroxylase-like FAD-dependent oxidoreductase